MNSFQYFRRILMFQKKYDSFQTFRIVAGTVCIPQNSLSFKISIFQGTDVIQKDRNSGSGTHYNMPQVIQVPDQSDSPDHITQIATIQHTPPYIGIVIFNSFNNLFER